MSGVIRWLNKTMTPVTELSFTSPYSQPMNPISEHNRGNYSPTIRSRATDHPKKSDDYAPSNSSTDTYIPSSQSGITDLNDVIAKNRELRKLSAGNSPVLFGGPKEEDKGAARNAYEWYIKNADVPGPYGSPEPAQWTKPGEAHQVGKWNDQINYVNKNGTTADKFVQRAALATGVAAAGTAATVGAAEVLFLGNESITVHGAPAPGVEPSLKLQGRPFFRANATGDWWRPTAWGRYRQAVQGGNPNHIANARYNLRPHYHRRPITQPAGPGQGIGQHRPWQGGW